MSQPQNVSPGEENALRQFLERCHVSFDAFRQLENKMTKDVLVTHLNGDRYDVARKVWNTECDKTPWIVAYCHDVNDAVLVVRFAREQNIRVCARAGGHSNAGYSVVNDGLVIDVSNIKEISIDEKNRQASVGAGVTWAEFNCALEAVGLHTPGGGCPSVGVAGFTLGGGWGYTSMRYGMGCDNLEQIKLVTADAKVVTANASENSDLYWAHRGGMGGNFGVVVEMTFKLYEMGVVWPIAVDWGVDDIAKVMHVWQEKMTKTLSDTKLGIFGYLASRSQQPPSDGQSLTPKEPCLLLRGLYLGHSWKDAEKSLQPLLDIGSPGFPHGPLGQRQVPYAEANEHALDDVMAEGFPQEAVRMTARCAYVNKALSVQQYQQIVDKFKTNLPNVYNVLGLEPYGGAVNERSPTDTAFVHRNAYFNVAAICFWSSTANKETAFTWLRDFYTSDDMKSIWSKEYFQSYPNDEYENWQEGYFGENYRRLRKVKSKWDPDNFFRYEQSIEPADVS